MNIRPTAGRFCSTRALKNLRYLQSVVPALIPSERHERDRVLPPADLARMHLPGYKPSPSASPLVSQILRSVKFPAVQDHAVAPLFNGTVYFAQFQFTDTQNNKLYSLAQADIQTAIQFATLAAGPISDYASAYGPNALAISPTILPYAVNLDGTSFSDFELQGWVNQLVIDNHLASNSCIVMLCPPGIVNSQSPLPYEIAYHYVAHVPYIFANLGGTGFTVADPHDFYVIALSHEMAEMTVDPQANLPNPEVCDPCGSNFYNNYIDYFDQNGLYLWTTETLPPHFVYTFCISAIVKPSGPFNSQAPYSACHYAPPGFGNLLDGKHAFWIADFLGLGHNQILTYYSGTGDWWLAEMQGALLKWSLVNHSSGFGNLLDHKHLTWIADFIGAGHAQILFYYSVDGWWLGDMQGGQLNLTLVSGSTPFGNPLDHKDPIWLADFTGSGHAQLMAYADTNHQWWLGNLLNGQFEWSKVGDTTNFGSLLDGKHPIWIADFLGLSHNQILTYYSGTGDWWIGEMQGNVLKWSLVNHSSGFGNLLDHKHLTWIADFIGAGHAQILFYYSVDGWWLGDMQGGQLNLTLVSGSTPFGNPLDGKHPIWIADFTGSGHAQLMLYESTNGHWELGNMQGTQLNWTLVSNTESFGTLLDNDHKIWLGDLQGVDHQEVFFYYNVDTHWWLGNIAGGALGWSLVGATGS